MYKDDLGHRMKLFESMESDRRFIPTLPIIARVDGRTFSSFTQGMERPFDARMCKAMVNTAKRLVKETGALKAYTQSDEITLLWHSENIKSQVWFDSRILKMNAVLASLTTLFFYQELCTDPTMHQYLDRNPCFVGHVFNVPSRTEGANNFMWRYIDATKNALSMVLRHYYTHDETLGKNKAQQLDMLKWKGVDFAKDFPDFFKFGTFVTKGTDDLQCLEHFNQVTNRIEVIFEGAQPSWTTE